MALFLLEVEQRSENDYCCSNEGYILLQHDGDYPGAGVGHYCRTDEVCDFFTNVLHERPVEIESFIGGLICPSETWDYSCLRVVGVRLMRAS